jgi:hypothetical protein
MGNNNIESSTSIVSDLQSTVNDVLIQNSQSCSGSIFSNQKLIIGTLKNVNIGDITQNSTSVLNLQCLSQNSSDTSLSTSMTTALNNKISQKATSQGTSALINNNVQVSNQITQDVSTIVNSTTVQNTMSCLASINPNQTIEIDSIEQSTIKGITQTASSDASLSCIQKNSATTQAYNDIASAITADSQQTAIAGFDTSVLIVIALVICAVLIALIFVGPAALKAFGSLNPLKGVFSSGSSTTVYQQAPPQYAPMPSAPSAPSVPSVPSYGSLPLKT